MKQIIFLFSKDALSIENLPLYGNKYWHTPNIEALAQNGTVFYNHYTSAASTSMVFSSMLTGKYPYEFKKRYKYNYVSPNEFESIFDVLQADGFDCHILWSIDYMTGAWPYVREFGNEEKTKIHIVDMHQPAGLHRKRGENLQRDDKLARQTIINIESVLESIEGDKLFIWLHLPHVLKGRISYGDDIDLVDELLGFVRSKYGDENIFFTADHGHMNFHKNIMGYGFHVYQLTCRVPLISPRINGMKSVDFLTSHVDLKKLILERCITKRDYVLVDSQYYAQPDRKLAIITERFKFIYNKRDAIEELYDLKWDPEERFNLLEDERYDKDKMMLRNTKELYFYPYHDEIPEQYLYFKNILNQVWINGTKKQESECKIKNYVKKIKMEHLSKKLLKERK